MRVDEGAFVSDDFYITNKKGVELHNVHGVLYLTGSKDDHAEATFYRNTWAVEDCVHVSLGIIESVERIQKVTMKVDTNEGWWYGTWNIRK